MDEADAGRRTPASPAGRAHAVRLGRRPDDSLRRTAYNWRRPDVLFRSWFGRATLLRRYLDAGALRFTAVVAASDRRAEPAATRWARHGARLEAASRAGVRGPGQPGRHERRVGSSLERDTRLDASHPRRRGARAALAGNRLL